MRRFSRWYRAAAAPRLAITVVRWGDGVHTACDPATWRKAFTQLDVRGLPATWAVVDGQTPWPLGGELLASRCRHELAYLGVSSDFRQALPRLARQRQIANDVDLPLRAVVASGGVHPSLLAQLDVAAVVLLGEGTIASRTGSLRALAWNVWEAPVTDHLGCNAGRPEIQRITGKVREVVRQSARMHLLWELPTADYRAQFGQLAPLWDLVSELNQRGWLVAETVGQAATEASRQMVSRRAA